MHKANGKDLGRLADTDSRNMLLSCVELPVFTSGDAPTTKQAATATSQCAVFSHSGWSRDSRDLLLHF